FYCKNETALLFAVVLTISSMIFTLPTMLTMSVSTLCTVLVIVASYYVKDSYWFESDTLNGISVLLFSFMFGWQVNEIRAEEAFARADSQRLNGELKKISITDPLTGLYNHRSFQDNYYEMFRRASTGGLPMGVIMMDLDKFKSFNDKYGHVAGDDCLRRVAAAIAASVPAGVIVCRYGGEEFIALLNEELCYKAADIGEDIRRAVAALKIPHICVSLEAKVVTLSLGAYVGVTVKNEEPMSFVDRADKAMYQSKVAGRNRLTVTFG
ncbi:MAG: diguanylate cyclase, partial [Hydrogenoanaerobacterium sp.]